MSPVTKLEIDAAVRRRFVPYGAHSRAEFGIYKGASLADLAVLKDSELTLIETKSDLDNLARLSSQEQHYSNVGDRCWLVTGDKLFAKAQQRVPPWWGLARVSRDGAEIKTTIERWAGANPSLSPVWLAYLLWKDELRAALESRGGLKGLSRLPVHGLARTLAARTSLDDLRACVRSALRARSGDAVFQQEAA